jgi:hypothetical protein
MRSGKASHAAAVLANSGWLIEFATDSSLEEAVSSELVSEANSLVTGKNTGKLGGSQQESF